MVDTMLTRMNDDYTERVALGMDGTYRWKCPVDREYERQGYKRAVIVCGIIFGGMTAFSGFLNVEFMLTMVLPIMAGTMAVIVLCLLLAGKSSGQTLQRYRMTGEYVEIVNMKASIYQKYDRIREIVIHPKYLILNGNIRGSRIYIPQEDFAFVKDFIINHTCGMASVRYAEPENN